MNFPSGKIFRGLDDKLRDILPQSTDGSFPAESQEVPFFF